MTRFSGCFDLQNMDLRIARFAGEFQLKWEWVRGHSGIEYNELCDKMTQEAIAAVR